MLKLVEHPIDAPQFTGVGGTGDIGGLGDTGSIGGISDAGDPISCSSSESMLLTPSSLCYIFPALCIAADTNFDAPKFTGMGSMGGTGGIGSI